MTSRGYYIIFSIWCWMVKYIPVRSIHHPLFILKIGKNTYACRLRVHKRNGHFCFSKYTKSNSFHLLCGILVWTDIPESHSLSSRLLVSIFKCPSKDYGMALSLLRLSVTFACERDILKPLVVLTSHFDMAS